VLAPAVANASVLAALQTSTAWPKHTPPKGGEGLESTSGSARTAEVEEQRQEEREPVAAAFTSILR